MGTELGPLPSKRVIDRHRPTNIAIYGYCAEDMRAYAAAEVAKEREHWRLLAASTAHDLSQARIWNGTGWHYNPLHPMYYKPALDRLRKALDNQDSHAV